MDSYLLIFYVLLIIHSKWMFSEFSSARVFFSLPGFKYDANMEEPKKKSHPLIKVGSKMIGAC